MLNHIVNFVIKLFLCETTCALLKQKKVWTMLKLKYHPVKLTSYRRFIENVIWKRQLPVGGGKSVFI